jgi:3-hydroxyethyl bacteriochlorophyllide a dehydrogenase
MGHPSMSTQAVVFSGVDQVEIQQIDVAAPAAGEVQIQTHFSSISSGTEGWALHNEFTWAATPFPAVPGYQRVGTITAVGADVDGWKEGDAVMATMGSWTASPVPFWGSHVGTANSKLEHLFHMPAGVNPVDAAATVVSQVGYNAAYRPSMEPGDWVVVYGDGPIGQFGAQAARARGARTILVGHRRMRLDIAAAHSADHALLEAADTVEQIQALTGQQHVPIVIDTVQKPQVQAVYMPLLEREKGQIVYSGFSPEETWASMADLHKNELTTHYISGITRPRMEATLDLIAAGKLRLEPLISHRVSYDQAPQMYRMIDTRSEPFLGILFEW